MAKGCSRKGPENVVGPMPAMGQVVKTDDGLLAHPCLRAVPLQRRAGVQVRLQE